MAPCNGTQQWHYVHSPKAHHNGTLQWHPAMPLRPLPQSWSSPSPPPTIAHDNGTLRWQPAMAPRPLHSAMVPRVPRPIRQSGSSPSPLLEVRTPIAIAIWESWSRKNGIPGYLFYPFFQQGGYIYIDTCTYLQMVDFSVGGSALAFQLHLCKTPQPMWNSVDLFNREMQREMMDSVLPYCWWQPEIR